MESINANSPRPAPLLVTASAPVDTKAIDLYAALAAAWEGKWWIIVFATICTAIAVAYAVLGERIYRSEVLLNVVEEEGGGMSPGASSGAIGALASLAGLSVGGAQGKRSEYIAMLTSRTVLGEFAARERVTPQLFPDSWDAAHSQWKKREPSEDDAIAALKRKVLTVSDDKRTGLVTLRVEWSDPEIAAKWANALVALVNERTRERAKNDARRSVEFLNRELENTTAVEIRQATFRLVEANLNRIMVANVQTDYALRVIDPATAADLRRYVQPRPLIEVPLALILGVGIGFGVALGRRRVAARRAAQGGE